MSFKRWDESIAPQLRAIANASEWIKHYSREARLAVSLLPERPPWVTDAQVALAEAEGALTYALEQVQQARKLYQKLEVADA